MSQGTQSSFNSFPKLEGPSNYTAWTIRLKSSLSLHGVLDVVYPEMVEKDVWNIRKVVEQSSNKPTVAKIEPLEEEQPFREIEEGEDPTITLEREFLRDKRILLRKIHDLELKTRSLEEKSEATEIVVAPTDTPAKILEKKSKACHIILMCLKDTDVVMLQSLNERER